MTTLQKALYGILTAAILATLITILGATNTPPHTPYCANDSQTNCIVPGDNDHPTYTRTPEGPIN